MRLKQKVMMSLIVLQAFILIACGGGGGGSSSDGHPVGVHDTVVLAEETIKALVSISEDGSELVFTEPTSDLLSLEKNDIIVSEPNELAPYGFLRKVNHIISTDNAVTIQTTGANLEEAIESGSANIQGVLTNSNIHSITPLVDGVNVKRFAMSQEDHTIISFNFHRGFDYVLDPWGILHLKGEMAISDINYDFNLSIKNKQIEDFRFTTTMSPQVRLENGCSQDISYSTVIGPIAIMQFQPIVFTVGVVPVVIAPKLDLYLGVEVGAQATISTEIIAASVITAGMSYSQTNGWQRINQHTPSINFQTPSVESSASAKVWGGPRLSMLLYNVSGPYGEIRVFSDFNANPSANPWWQLYWGLELSLGVDMGMLSDTLAPPNWSPFELYRAPLAQASSPAPPDPDTIQASDFVGTWIGNLTFSSAFDNDTRPMRIELAIVNNRLGGILINPSRPHDQNQLVGFVQNGVFYFDILVSQSDRNNPDCAGWDIGGTLSLNSQKSAMTFAAAGYVCGPGQSTWGTLDGGFVKN